MADNDNALMPQAKVELSPFAKPFVNMSPEEAMAVYGGGYGPDPISANVLWNVGKGLYGLMSVPSQVVSGEFPVVPGSRDVNDLMPITEYASGLALAGIGMGATPELLAGQGFNPAFRAAKRGTSVPGRESRKNQFLAAAGVRAAKRSASKQEPQGRSIESRPLLRKGQGTRLSREG